MALSPSCPVCDSHRLATITERPSVPVHQNKLYDTAVEAREAARGDLHIVACLRCGFVFNAAFDLSLLSYEQGYDNDQTHSPAFSDHVKRLADRLLNENRVRNSRIVEVGSGKGTFLRELVEADESNVGWGFDPAYRGPETALDGRVTYVRSFYDGDYADLSPDVVICRHVIEHVPAPAELLSEIRQASSNARVFFETPDVEWILRNKVIWDFFYEHCSYFSFQSFATLFERAGFAGRSTTRVFGDQYLWVEAQASALWKKRTDADAGAIPDLVHEYARAEKQLRERWASRMRALRDSGGVALWGAGAKGATCMYLLDPDAESIGCVVDINPAKQGRFVAGSGHPIVSPADFVEMGVQNVVLMNPNYEAEVRAFFAEKNILVNLVVDIDADAAA